MNQSASTPPHTTTKNDEQHHGQDLVAIITTIQTPTDCVRGLGQTLASLHAPLIAIGDKKGPASFDLPDHPDTQFVSLDEQLALDYQLAKILPVGHYARKNIGYLLAIARGAACLYETDDDNAPLPDFKTRHLETHAAAWQSDTDWCNVYRLFTDELIWPRGFPLDRITDQKTYDHTALDNTQTYTCPIQQGLANIAPDVDAVWRLVLDRPFDFRANDRSVWLPRGVWCPFNSQTTWWWPIAYPLMYLPSYCSFRMTDIWRSFIAQRCLWELDFGLVFHAPEVYQERNVHNLMRDFSDEVPGYEGNTRLCQELTTLSLDRGTDAVGPNMLRCYEHLVQHEFFPDTELDLVRAWLSDLSAIV